MALPSRHDCMSTVGLPRQFSYCRVLQKKSGSSNDWLQRQMSDPYVKQARAENWRCRSAYKLLEMDARHKLLAPGSVVVDCGAAPGSWSQVAAQKVKIRKENESDKPGVVISVDLQYMEPIEGVTVFGNADFTDPATQRRIQEVLGERRVNTVLSDMAPRASGTKHLDRDAIFRLCLSVLKFSSAVLAPGGSVLCKMWMGSEQEQLETVMARMFRQVKVVKPKASRGDSAEIYILGKDFILANK